MKLTAGRKAAYDVLRDRNEHSLPELAERTGYPAASISARIRELPKCEPPIFYRKRNEGKIVWYKLADRAESIQEHNTALITAYRDSIAAHPTWTPVEISQFTGEDIKDMRLIGKLLGADPVFLDAYERGVITDAVASVMLSRAVKVSIEDKRIVLAKIEQGVVTGTEVRDLLKLLPSTRGLLRLEWINVERRMTYKELLAAKLDSTRGHALSTENAIRHEDQIKAGIKLDWPIKAEDWINDLDSNVDVLEEHLGDVVKLTFQRGPMADKLRDASKRLWELANAIEGRRGEETVRLADPRVIDM